VPVATLIAGKVQLLQQTDAFTTGEWQAALIRQPNTPTPLAQGPQRSWSQP
jgi:ATP-dependent Lhr-like helicase